MEGVWGRLYDIDTVMGGGGGGDMDRGVNYQHSGVEQKLFGCC